MGGGLTKPYPALLFYALDRPNAHIRVRVGDGDNARLCRVAIMAMAALLANLAPTVCLNDLDDVAAFHTH